MIKTMKNPSVFRFCASAILLGAASPVFLTSLLSAQNPGAAAQSSPAATQSLLDKADALEIRGRIDMAAQTWQQVLLADPNNARALGGLARAARQSGNAPLAQTYIDRLRQVNPNDPGIARAETMGTQVDHKSDLVQAGKLAEQGHYGESMEIYRRLYGDQPPTGDIALAYYETEAATEEGRAQAIAGLRALISRVPGDERFVVALGRILTYNPKTRVEGRRLLREHPLDLRAQEAIRQSLLWDAQNPAMAGEIREYLAHHNDVQLAEALRMKPRPGEGIQGGPSSRRPAPLSPLQRMTAEAYRALNAGHLDEAERLFKAILAQHPDSPPALTGMGYVRMQQRNFGGAISFLAQAQQDGSKDKGLEEALATSRFWYTMGEGAAALRENDLPAAEKQYRLALGMKPHSPEALEGLGGTLLKAQQPGPAIPYLAESVRLKPTVAHAWRGLFLAQFGADQVTRALATEKMMPPVIRAELYKDPLYLRALSSAFADVGDDADAQRVIRAALDLPFPADARGLEIETQLQYAGLLQAAHRLEQAAGLYRQVLAKDQSNTDAWEGLVRVEHAQGHDEEALQTIESMPPATYAKVMRNEGFEATVAGIYQANKRLDVAQEILEKAIAQETSSGQKPAAPAELELAGIYLLRNDPQKAFPIYRQVLTENPDRAEAWKGLLAALHDTHHDSEALAEVQQIPQATRARLENDVAFLQTMGAIYSDLGQPQQAQLFLRRVQEYYAFDHSQAPADVDIESAWLLYNGMNDAGLYRQLMMLGGRNDLSDDQRRTIQTIWTNWAVRRANQAAAAGDFRRALNILNATARAFPDNPGVIKALAAGYARAGMAKEAILIWKAQDLNGAPALDYKAAVGAALAAGDMKDAEIWLRFGLERYPKDPELLILGAKFEAARGNTNVAADYYRASLSAMPPADPGAELANELSRPVPMSGGLLPNGKSAQDLANLLAPSADDKAKVSLTEQPDPTSNQPYLPSYGNAAAPVQIDPRQPRQMDSGDPVVPSYMTSPTPNTQNPSPAQPSGARLRDYVPQASVDELLPPDATRLPESVIAEYGDTSGPVLTPAVFQQQQVTRVTDLADSQQNGPQQATKLLPLTTQPASEMVPPPQAAGAQNAAQPAIQTSMPQGVSVIDPATGEVYGPYVPYKATPVQLGNTTPAQPVPQPEVTDVLPTARYVPNAKSNSNTSSHPDVNAANAAAIRRRQSDPPMTGQSKPPAEEITTDPPTEAVQYQPYTGQTPQQGGDSRGQQYPQPNTGRTTPPSRGRVRARAEQPRRPAPATPMPEAPAPMPQPMQSGLSYPGVGQPLGYQPYPTVGPTYPLGTVPTDDDLMGHRLPPLGGSYSGTLLASQVPLSPREQAERELATLEGSYSGWAGGTGSARYRSGTAGLDRLTDLEATVEASATLGNNVRLSIIPKAVFLNSGTLNSGNYAGLTSGVPVLGTLPASAVNPPSAQNANGVGGEFQVSTRNLAAAIGYTPYEFLIRNFTGRALFKPDRHFTLYFNRDSVVETQLSYAGLRDPGTVSAVYPGNIWGGVIATGGGVRLDMGDEHAGFYISADGSDLTGYHVLENTKFEASAGAYFLAHTFPGYGKLNVGAQMFGMHFSQNERGLSYGLGGYFSPMRTSWHRCRSPMWDAMAATSTTRSRAAWECRPSRKTASSSSRWIAGCRAPTPRRPIMVCLVPRCNQPIIAVRSIR